MDDKVVSGRKRFLKIADKVHRRFKFKKGTLVKYVDKYYGKKESK